MSQVQSNQAVSKANGQVKSAEPTMEELKAKLIELTAQLEAKNNRTLEIRISENTGAVSVYGLGQFPVSLHEKTWRRLLAYATEVIAFLDKFHANLSEKDVDWNPVVKLAGVPESAIQRNKAAADAKKAKVA